MTRLSQKATGSILVSHCKLSDTVQNKFTIYFKRIINLSYYNKIRVEIFNSLIERFIDPVIEKGLTRKHQREILKTNYQEFKNFLERKIRYFLHTLFISDKLLPLSSNYNDELSKKLNYNTQKYLETSTTQLAEIEKINNEFIAKSNLTTFPKIVVDYLLTQDQYKEQLLNYFNEFLQYLLLF